MLRHKLFWLILALSGCLAAALLVLPRLATTDASWEQAREAMTQRDYRRAQTHLIDYVVRWDQDMRGHVMLARCYRQAASEDLESATDHLLKAGRLGGTSHDLELEANLLEFQEYGGPPETRRRLEAHLESHPDEGPLILEALARGCIRAGRLNSANLWLDRWVREHPGDWWARLWRGSLFQHMGRPQLAIEDFRHALQQQPDNARALKHLGQVLATSGYDYEEARQLLQRYLEQQPEDADALAALAISHHASGQLDAARQAAERALRLQAEHADALRVLAQVQLDRSEYEKALETLKAFEAASRAYDPQRAQGRLLAMDPALQTPHETQRAEEALHLRTRALRGLGREDEAQQCVERLDQLQRDAAELNRLLKQRTQRDQDADYLYEVTDLYLRIGQPYAARQSLQQLFQLQPQDPRLETLQQSLNNLMASDAESR